MPSLEIIKSDIAALSLDIHVDASTPDLFFFRGTERHLPFATIVTRDTEFDNFSRLNDNGAFRLNIALGRDKFRERFPTFTSLSALEAADFDYAIYDELLPHPIYGRMYWAYAVNPDKIYGECLALLGNAYELSRR